MTFGNVKWKNGSGGADIGADIAYNAPPPWKATVGGLQISNFLKSKTASSPAEGLVYFKDSLFLDYMLAMYSNIKILDNGTSVKQGPEPVEDIKISSLRRAPSAERYSHDLFSNHKAYFTTTGAYDKSNAFLAKRINPYLMASNRVFRPKGLVELFHDHLVAREPLDWTEKERRLFLLMSGQHYAKNDLGYLNLMEADADRPGPVFENFYGTKVLKFWHDNFNAAATIEGAQETPEL